jgi:hypothetical protein
LFLTIQAPFRPLSGPSITFMVGKRLTKQGVQLNWRGATFPGILDELNRLAFPHRVTGN